MKKFFSRLCLGVVAVAILIFTIPVYSVNMFKLSFEVLNTGIAMVDYPQTLTLNTQQYIAKGKMKTDCGDIRFYDADGTTQLLFWLESGCNTANTVVWVKIPAVPVGGKTIYMEFGDTALVSASSPFSIFMYYDTMLTATNGCVLSGAASYNVGNYLQLNPASGGLGRCEYAANPGNGWRVKFDFYSGGGNGADSSWFYAYNNTSPITEDRTAGGYHFTIDEYQDRMCFTKSTVDNGTGLACASDTTLDNATWKTMDIKYYNANAVINLNGTQVVNFTDPTPISTTGTRMGFGGRTGGLVNEHRIRNVTIMKYSPFVSVEKPIEDVKLSFSIRNDTDTGNLTTCNAGTATTANISQCKYRLRISTNATNGYNVLARTSGNFINTGNNYPIINAVAGTGVGGGTSINNTNNGTEMYGVKINPNQSSLGFALTVPSAFYVGTFLTNANSVKFNHTTDQLIMTSTSANLPNTAAADTTNTAIVTHNLNIGSGTPAGTYSQLVYYTVVAGF
jgi:hypothetical protein